MKKNYIFAVAVVLFLAAFESNAQTLERQVIAAAGDYFVSPGLSLSWTLGEPVTETVSNYDVILTQGFQQADKITVTTVREPLSNLFDIKIFPNPTTDYLNIRINSERDEIIIAQLYSLQGQKVIERKMQDTQFQLDLAALPAAGYLLSFRKLNGELITTYMVNKAK